MERIPESHFYLALNQSRSLLAFCKDKDWDSIKYPHAPAPRHSIQDSGGTLSLAIYYALKPISVDHDTTERWHDNRSRADPCVDMTKHLFRHVKL